MKNKNLLALSLFVTLSASQAFAAQAVYRCDSTDNTADSVTLTIGNSHFVQVDEDVADLDEKYDPRLNVGYSMFDYEQSVEGTTEVLVQDRLLKGSKYGFIKIQNRGEGFESSKFACTKQD
jgi:hypothetical protein